MFERLKELKKKGYVPKVILDIGAYHGYWTNSMRHIYADSKYYLFEAIDYNELDKFKDNKNVEVFKNIILFDKKTQVDWYQMKNTGDSIFREKTCHFKNCEIIKRDTIDLDTFITHKNILNNTDNILNKIDCQGAEIPILKGASSILNKTDFIILEIPFFGQYNEGVPDFLEHIKFMDSIGFTVYDMLENHYVGGFNIQVDILFINKNHIFNETVKNK